LASVIDFSGYPGLGALHDADIDRAFSAFTNAILLRAAPDERSQQEGSKITPCLDNREHLIDMH